MQIDVLTGSVSEGWSLEINIYFIFFLKKTYFYFMYMDILPMHCMNA